MVEFGRKIKELRQSVGMTQKQLADLLGVTSSVVSYYELSERTPSPDVLIKLSAIFHVSTDYLLGLDKTESIAISGLSEDDKRLIHNLIDNLKKKNN